MVAGVVTSCFSLSTKFGPRSDAWPVTVALAPGGFESITTSWYGPCTNVAQPLSAASAAARNVAWRVIGTPFRGRAPLPGGSPARPGRPERCARSARAILVRSLDGLWRLLRLPEHGLLERLGNRESDLLA